MKLSGMWVILIGLVLSLRGEEPKDEFTPLKNNVQAVLSTLDEAKMPLEPDRIGRVREAIEKQKVREIDQILDQAATLKITINPEGRVRVASQAKQPQLTKGLPSLFLIRIENQSGGKQKIEPVANYFGKVNPFQIKMADAKGYNAELKGELIEYRLLRVVCQEAGKWELSIGFNAGQGTQDIGFRGEVPILFNVIDRK